jgi:hypothetical protein
MSEHTEAESFGKRSRPSGKSQRAISIALGLLIVVAGFALVLSIVAWFVPKFLRFANPRSAPLVAAISILFICTSGLVRYLRKRQNS